jgi:CYTH domain-containing protein
VSGVTVRRTRYSIDEIERRWLVDRDVLGPLHESVFVEITDRYLEGTRLRLRRMDDGKGGAIFKLCRKYGKTSPLSEPMTNLYLTEAEYLLLSALDGREVRKRRYAMHGGSLDVYAGDPAVVIFECEFATEAAAIAFVPPDFVGEELTGDGSRDGAAIARR